MDPEVSVVMCVYNHASYLPDCIESILSQDGVTFELIAVNDGSTDHSGSILDEYAHGDSRLKVLHQDNLGLTGSLIVGCSMARGRYIARQDSDDISFPGRLRRLRDELDKFPSAVLTSSSTVLMGPRGELLSRNLAQSAVFVESWDATFCHGSLMFRRDAYERVGGYRPQFRAAQDVDLQFRLSELGAKRIVPELLYASRKTEDSISATSPIQESLSRLAAEARGARVSGGDEVAVLEEASRSSAVRPGLKRTEPGTGNYFIGRCLYARRDRRAIKYLLAACKTDPLSPRRWLALAQASFLTKSSKGHDVNLAGIVPRNSH
jgi:glycosyltransferase involved in cell wall biosynthesis